MITEINGGCEEVTYRAEIDVLGFGTLVHVGKISAIGQVLEEGLLSQAFRARRDGREVKNPGFWYPNDNLVVKFIKLESEDRKKNFRSLHSHFGDFGDFGIEHNAVGYVVENPNAKRLAENEPYFYIEDVVSTEDIRACVLPVVPMLNQMPPILKYPTIRELLKKLFLELGKLQKKGKLEDLFLFLIILVGRLR